MNFEAVSVVTALLAVVISLVSLIRTRKYEGMQLALEKIQADLAAKQLEQLVAEEDLEGQPRFAVRVTSIGGFGDPQTPQFQVQIRIRIDNTGDSYLEPQYVSLATRPNKLYLQPQNAYLEPVDVGESDAILGDHTLIVRSGADLSTCKLLISYIDNAGLKRIQVFDLAAEGAKGECVPYSLHFTYREIHHMMANPEYAWRF